MGQNKQIKISPKAEDDLSGIYLYGFFEFGEVIADNYLLKLDETFKLLARHDIGTTRSDIQNGIKSFPVGRHVIFFRSVKNSITILRVLHHSRDVDLLL